MGNKKDRIESKDLMGEPVSLQWMETKRAARFDDLIAMVDPATIAAVIGKIVDLYSSNQKAKAEEAFRKEVLEALQEIENQLRQIHQELVELGVKLDAEIAGVPVRVAFGGLEGELAAAQVAYPALDREHARAQAIFDRLNAATGTAAAYGPALLPQISLGIITLLAVLEHTGYARQKVLVALKARYLPVFQAMLAGAPGSITAQEGVLDALVAQATNFIDQVPVGRFKMGTHNYGHTEAFLNSVRTGPDTFNFIREDRDIPQPEHHGGGHRGGDPRPALIKRKVIHEYEIDPSLGDLFYYATGARALEAPAEVWGRFGGDRHGSFYDNWIATIGERTALCARIRAAARSARPSLEHAQRLASKLINYCQQ